MMFYVVGGKYTDTDFLVPDDELETMGPYNTWELAYQMWFARSMFHVDSCLTRYQIMPEGWRPAKGIDPKLC